MIYIKKLPIPIYKVVIIAAACVLAVLSVAESIFTEQVSGEHVFIAEVEFPVFMYHDILKDPSRQGSYTITPTEFEEDLKYLMKNGYETIVVGDLIDYVYDNKPLPDKPVMITFDDGHFNNVYYAQSLLEEYGMRAVMFVVGAYCDKAVEENEENPNYSYVTWERIGKMAESGIWEIQAHSWDMHSCLPRKGVKQKYGEDIQSYICELETDFTMIAEAVEDATKERIRPVAFAYPYGCYTKESEQVLRETGYLASFCSEFGFASVSAGDRESLYLLRRMSRGSGISAQMLIE